MREQREVVGPRIRTMEQAEEVGYRWMALGAGMIGVGVLVSLTVVFIALGAPLILAGAVLVLADIAWMFAISRRMTQEVFCPFCHKRNLALEGVSSFACDECGREIALRATVPPPAAGDGAA